MAAVKYQIKVVQGSKETFVETDDLEVLFKALGVDGVALTKDIDGNLVVDAPILAPAGDGPTALVTTAELDAEIARAEAAEGVLTDDLEQEVIDRAADVDAEQDRAEAAEGVLQTNIGAEAAARVAADAALDGRVDTLESTATAHDTRLDVLESVPYPGFTDFDEVVSGAAKVTFQLAVDIDGTHTIDVWVDGRMQRESAAWTRDASLNQFTFTEQVEIGQWVRARVHTKPTV